MLTIAVLSDIHAYSKPLETRPSHLPVDAPEDRPRQHPFVSLTSLISDRKLSADVVLCCGDMGDKGDPDGIRFTWGWVNRLATVLAPKYVIGTAGNHDVDSRGLFTPDDAMATLRGLVPRFPIPSDDSLCDSYWARGFAVIAEPDYRVVLLNSSAHHVDAAEAEKGKVSEQLLADLEVALTATGSRPINVLACHHHPFRHGDIDHADYSAMEGAPELLNLLGSGRFGHWLIIHGHKHHPRLRYASGTGAAPVILSAGSLSAELYLELQTRARNQFYIVELDAGVASQLGLGLAGRVQAWDWVAAKGWDMAARRSGLPARGGFGYRSAGDVIAADIAGLVAASQTGYMTWQEVMAQRPRLDYLLPEDTDSLCDSLQTRGFKVLVDHATGAVEQIGSST